jgi:hypothetical protein
MSVTSSRCYPRAVKTFPDRRPFCPTLSGRIRSAPTEPIFSCQTDPIRAAVTACANHQTQGGSMNDQVYFLFTMSDYLPSKAQAGKLFDARRELALSSRRPASRAGYRTSQPAPNEPGNENAWDLESNSGAESTKHWWSQTGSNRRPHACKARALPTELWPHRREQGRKVSSPTQSVGKAEWPPALMRGAKVTNVTAGT